MALNERRARELCITASQAPWTIDPREKRSDGSYQYFPSIRFRGEQATSGSLGTICVNASHNQTSAEIEATAEFMAESRTMLPEALDKIAELRAALLAACNLAREAMDAYTPGKEPRNLYDRRLKNLLAKTISDEQIRDLLTRPSTTQELQALCRTALWPETGECEPDRTIARARVAKILHPRELGSALSW